MGVNFGVLYLNNFVSETSFNHQRPIQFAKTFKKKTEFTITMDRWRGRVAVVTGASAGIGAAVCKLLANEGMKVVGCARRLEKVEELAKENANIYPIKVQRNYDRIKT